MLPLDPRFLRPLLLSLVACTAAPTDEPAPDPPGVDASIPAAPGEARAGVIDDDAALFGGITAEGRHGDIKLYNDRVQLILQGAYRSHGYIDTAGGILDLERVTTDGVLPRDTVEDLFLGFDMSRLFHADTVEVVADGSDGTAAIVEAHGTDVPWLFIQNLLEYAEPVKGDMNLDITVRYELPPDSSTVLISTTLVNGGDAEVSFTPQQGAFASAEDLLTWVPGQGLNASASVLDAAIYTGRQGETTWSFWPDTGAWRIGVLSVLTGDLGIFLADHPTVTLAPGESTTLVHHLAIADDPASTEAMRWSAQGVPLSTVTGSTGVPGARVHIVDPAGAVVAAALTDAVGELELELPDGDWTAYVVARSDGQHVELPAGAGRFGPFTAPGVNQLHLDVLDGTSSAAPRPYATGRPSPAPVDFSTPRDAPLDIPLAGFSGVRVTLTDGTAPLPGILDLQWAGPVPDSPIPSELRSALGVPTGGRASWAWTSTGTAVIPAPPGSFTLLAGHSWRYEQATTTVTVTEGQITEVTLTLDEVVPRDGWLSLDPHLHASPSFDGALPMEDRLVTCAAAGVDLPVATDHDAMAEYRALSTSLGLDDRMRVVPGVESTSLLRGHLNVYPLTPHDHLEPNGGAGPWWYDITTTDDLFQRMRELIDPDSFIQVNHPLGPGMWSSAGFDPATATPRTPSNWSWDFDLFELLNGGSLGFEGVREAWFGMLNHGHIRTPTGASDSHYRFIPCGQSRTDVFFDTNTPGDVSREDLVAALSAGHVVAATGVSLRASMSEGDQSAMPGDTLQATSAGISVLVRSPSWIVPEIVQIVRNGEIVHTEVLPLQATDGVWFDDTIEVTADADAWFVVEVIGSRSLGAMWRDTTPYAATNAFFLDVDSDGWTPPGPP